MQLAAASADPAVATSVSAAAIAIRADREASAHQLDEVDADPFKTDQGAQRPRRTNRIVIELVRPLMRLDCVDVGGA